MVFHAAVASCNWKLFQGTITEANLYHVTLPTCFFYLITTVQVFIISCIYNFNDKNGLLHELL